ncbi:uncharacterized protein PV06_00853 [Exophiala oligosperma]|uniref:Uncharacterized protein n=1 Tax=Exophiala oligosperma TaxID=215243 RepID=A0A0D2B7N1_9EURO|nr:uncharacterized protein PV06_00853 [Exophiala oligosperma]KIW48246.1 hypothetical protein PV06_00853 [Exophiala oligosperma]
MSHTDTTSTWTAVSRPRLYVPESLRFEPISRLRSPRFGSRNDLDKPRCITAVYTWFPLLRLEQEKSWNSSKWSKIKTSTGYSSHRRECNPIPQTASRIVRLVCQVPAAFWP